MNPNLCAIISPRGEICGLALTVRARKHIGCWLALLSLAGGCEPDATTLRTDHPAHPPAQRIITLAPHLTELVYSVGAGDRLIGVVEHSDYPPEARSLPRIGDAFRVDLERVAELRPDLILAWKSGNPLDMLEKLHSLGHRVVSFEPRHLSDIATHLIEIGALVGKSEEARRTAGIFERRVAKLRARYSAARPLRVFYQISERPLYTINGDHLISELIAFCGGNNVFADLDDLAPVVSVEAILTRDPEVIITGLDAGYAWFEAWRKWSELAAVRHDNLFSLDATLVTRATTRILEGVEQMCAALEQARENTEASPDIS